MMNGSHESSTTPVETTHAAQGVHHHQRRRRHHRVLVIGSTGAGKSTLINALVGYEAMRTSSDAVGCTGFYSSVTTERKRLQQQEEDDSNAADNHESNVTYSYEFIDTVGVNEPEEGTVSRADALKLFFKFLKDNKEGFNLIIFCTREGRMTEESKATYEIMVKKLYSSSACKKVPPVLIFVGGTFLEYEHPQDWCERNRSTFLRQGYAEADPALDAFHAISLPPKSKNAALEAVFQTTRAESTDRAWQTIERAAVPAPIELYSNVKGLIGLVQHLWNAIAKNFGWPLIIPDVLREIAKACGFTSREISELTDQETIIFF